MVLLFNSQLGREHPVFLVKYFLDSISGSCTFVQPHPRLYCPEILKILENFLFHVLHLLKKKKLKSHLLCCLWCFFIVNIDWWRMKSWNLYLVCKGPNHFYGPNLQMLYLFLYLVLPLVSRICMTRYASWVCGVSLVWEYVQVELVGGQWLGKPPWLFGSYPYWIVLKIDIYTYRMREIPFLYVTHTKICCNIYFNAFPY